MSRMRWTAIWTFPLKCHMVCLSVTLLCYRITRSWLSNKRFGIDYQLIKKGRYLCWTLYIQCFWRNVVLVIYFLVFKDLKKWEVKLQYRIHSYAYEQFPRSSKWNDKIHEKNSIVYCYPEGWGCSPHTDHPRFAADAVARLCYFYIKREINALQVAGRAKANLIYLLIMINF